MSDKKSSLELLCQYNVSCVMCITIKRTTLCLHGTPSGSSEEPSPTLGHPTLALKFPVGHTAWDIVVVPCQFGHCLDVAVHSQGVEEGERGPIG